MPKFVALLRGINVGGRNMVAMKDLRDLLTGLGFENVETILQSGNVIFDGPAAKTKDLEHRLEEAMRQKLQMSVEIVVMTAQ